MPRYNENLAVLFADITDSTKLYSTLGDNAARVVVNACLTIIAEIVERCHGRVVKTIGDEVMAVFEQVDDAFQASTEMQQSVSDLPLVSGVKLAIRVGFQHGSVIEEAGDVFGDCVNTAARLAGLAKPGQVLIGSQTQRALSRLLQMSTRDLGRMSVKGKADEVHVFEAIWQESDELTMKAASVRQRGGSHSLRLCLRYADQVIMLDDMKSALNMGRDPNCEVAIRDRRASRNHAKIERRGEKFVLTDQSTNGTYVTFTGEPELFLRREELVLRGSGLICFVALAANEEADCAEFEHL